MPFSIWKGPSLCFNVFCCSSSKIQVRKGGHSDNCLGRGIKSGSLLGLWGEWASTRSTNHSQGFKTSSNKKIVPFPTSHCLKQTLVTSPENQIKKIGQCLELKVPRFRNTGARVGHSASPQLTIMWRGRHFYVERTHKDIWVDLQYQVQSLIINSGLAVSSPKTYHHQYPRFRNSVKLFSTVYTGQYFNRPNISIFQYYNRPNISTFHLSWVSSIKL